MNSSCNSMIEEKRVEEEKADKRKNRVKLPLQAFVFEERLEEPAV